MNSACIGKHFTPNLFIQMVTVTVLSHLSTCLMANRFQHGDSLPKAAKGKLGETRQHCLSAQHAQPSIPGNIFHCHAPRFSVEASLSESDVAGGLLFNVCLFVPRLSLWKNVPPKTAIREPGARPPFTQPRIDHSPSSGFKWSRNFRYASNPAAGRPILWPRDIGAWQTKSLARGIAFSSPMPSMSFPRLPFMSLPPRLEALTELKRDCGPIFSLMGLVSIVWNQPGAVFIAEASPLRARGHSGHCFPLKAAPFWPPSSS